MNTTINYILFVSIGSLLINESIVYVHSSISGCLRLTMICSISGKEEVSMPLPDEYYDQLHLVRLDWFRLFRLHALATRMREPWRKDKDRKNEKSQDPPYYTVTVTVDDSSAESNAESITLSEGYFVIALNREIMLPIMWPTVINKIHFALILSKGKKTRRIVARSSIRLNSIYVAGEDGFLPTFGPSFINFYGPQRVPRLKRRREKHPEKDFDEHMYYCRLLVSVDCFDTPSDDSTVAEISVDAHKFATPFEKYFKYVMCGSFFICSNIDPSFNEVRPHSCSSCRSGTTVAVICTESMSEAQLWRRYRTTTVRNASPSHGETTSRSFTFPADSTVLPLELRELTQL
ncbi:hypothetical protein PRIPAC_84915 [Pristionchus pacificus]|nr:hypothetical protein PRIPAC_84915 [Pristionchus pacificus]